MYLLKFSHLTGWKTLVHSSMPGALESNLPCCYNQMLDQSNQRKESFLLPPRSGVPFIIEGKPRWQESEVAGHIAPTVMRQRMVNMGLQPACCLLIRSLPCCGTTHIQDSSPNLEGPRNPHVQMSRGLLSRGSKSCQIHNQD